MELNIMTFEDILRRSFGMLAMCRWFILTGTALGVIPPRLKTLIDAELRRKICSNYEPDEILSELVMALHTVWSRYKPGKGDFGPYLVASFHYEAKNRFVNCDKLEIRFCRNNELEMLASELENQNPLECMEEIAFATPELQAFNSRDEMIFIMRFIHGMRIYDIAEELGISTKTVQRSLNKTTEIIRKNERLKRHALACGYIEEL